MSRQLLANKVGCRGVYTATFAKQSVRPGKKGYIPTCMLEDLQDSHGQLVCTHMWFTVTEKLRAADMTPGDKIRFMGKVEEYEKNHFSRNPSGPCDVVDYRLTGLTHIINLSKIGAACNCSH